MKTKNRFRDVLVNGKQKIAYLMGVAVVLTGQSAMAKSSLPPGFASIVPNVSQNGIVTSIAGVATDIFGIITVAALAFGLIFIAWGGIGLIHAGGQKRQEAMEKIRNAIIGLVVALAAGLITGAAVFVANTFTGNIGGATSNAASNAVGGIATALVNLIG